MTKYVAQHEFDDDDTYVVAEHDGDDSFVTFDSRLPWQVRQPLARLVARVLGLRNPVSAAEHLEQMAQLLEKDDAGTARGARERPA